jgi:hypothetical protein
MFAEGLLQKISTLPFQIMLHPKFKIFLRMYTLLRIKLKAALFHSTWTDIKPIQQAAL